LTDLAGNTVERRLEDRIDFTLRRIAENPGFFLIEAVMGRQDYLRQVAGISERDAAAIRRFFDSDLAQPAPEADEDAATGSSQATDVSVTPETANGADRSGAD